MRTMVDQEEQRLLNSEAILRNLMAEFKRQGIKVRKIDEDTFSYKGVHFDLQDAPTDTLNGIVYLIAPSKQTIPVREENLAETVKMVVDYVENQHEQKGVRKRALKKYVEGTIPLPDPITLYVNGQRYELESDPAYIITTMDFRKAEIRVDDIKIVARIETKEPFFTYDWSVVAYYNNGWNTKVDNVAPYYGFNIPIEDGIATNFREVGEALDHVMHDYRMQSISGYYPDYNASAKKSWMLSKNIYKIEERVRVNNATHNKMNSSIGKSKKLSKTFVKKGMGASLKAETKGLDADDIRQPIRDWYTSAYPDDDLGMYLSDITFHDLHTGISQGLDIYDHIGVGDSIVRERLFDRLAELKSTSYNAIYDMWLGARKSMRKSSIMNVRSASQSNFMLNGEIVDVFLTDDGVYIGLSSNYDNQGHYDNSDGSLLHVSSLENVYHALFGSGWAYTFEEMADTFNTFASPEEVNRVRDYLARLGYQERRIQTFGDGKGWDDYRASAKKSIPSFSQMMKSVRDGSFKAKMDKAYGWAHIDGESRPVEVEYPNEIDCGICVLHGYERPFNYGMNYYGEYNGQTVYFAFEPSFMASFEAGEQYNYGEGYYVYCQEDDGRLVILQHSPEKFRISDVPKIFREAVSHSEIFKS